jgi:hypothetical protein
VIVEFNVKYVFEMTSFLSDCFTVIASGIAIYIYFSKKKDIKSVIDLLMNYSHQLTLTELKEKIEKLNDYNVKDAEQCEKVVNIFNEIIGQIRGNDNLKASFCELIGSIENLLSDKRRLTEPRKRALVSELRERLRHLNVKNINKYIGDIK